eukprot:jgi/Chrzof1/2972/Cz12g06160.t1
MRKACPISCNVEPCASSGTALRNYRYKGYASPSGTWTYAGYLQHHVAHNHYKELYYQPEGKEEETILLSSLGMGTYLGEADDLTDEQTLCALLFTITHGWNVIDTASNYRNGRAESTVGKALSLLLAGIHASDFAKGRADVTRDALFISTKAGYLSPTLQQTLLTKGLISHGDVVGGGHCMAPACLRASVEESLEKMNIETVDLLYLHNAAESQLPVVGLEVFLQRLKAAFLELEMLKTQGKLRGYGLATWDCFRVASTSNLYLSLQDVVDVAVDAGGEDHAFMAVQLPFNAQLHEAYTGQWQLVRPEQPQQQEEDGPSAGSSSNKVKGMKPEGETVKDQLAFPPAAPLDRGTVRTLLADVGDAANSEVADGTEKNANGVSSSTNSGKAGGSSSSSSSSSSTDAAGKNSPVTFLDAAARLGVLVFTSSPLSQGQLVRGRLGEYDDIFALRNITTTSGKLLHYARSTPGVAAALVGHKTQEHVRSNLQLSKVPRMSKKLFKAVHKHMQKHMLNN